MESATKDYLITKEVAQTLGVSEATVYKYIKENKITPMNLKDWQIDKEYRFSIREVERVKENMEIKPGYTTKEVAERVGCTTQTILRYIKEGKLQSQKHMYRGIERNFISTEDVVAFEKEYKHTIKTHFVKDKCYLFQSYQLKGAETNGKARIVSLDENGNGLALKSDGETIPLEEIFQSYDPIYPVTTKPSITKKGNAIFRFSKPAHIHSSIYKLIEIIQTIVGINNMKIEVTDETVQLELKPTFLPFSKGEDQDEIDLLKNHLVEGKLIQRDTEIYIDSDIETIQTHVSKELKDILQKRAKEKNMSISDLLRDYLEQQYLKD